LNWATEFLKRYNSFLKVCKKAPIDLTNQAIAPGPQHDKAVVTTRGSISSGPALAPTDPLKTVLPFINAAGRVIMLVLIFANVHGDDGQLPKPVYHDSDLGTNTRSRFPILYASTDNGYITSELWVECCMKLAEILKPIRRGDPALILFDRHSAHLKTEAILKLVENDIEPVFVPPHMTHILQPLDNVPFAVFKKKLAAEKTKFVASAIFNRQMPTDVLQQTVVKAFTESFNEKVISRAWSDTGLSPFDENLIIQRAKQVCPPPEEEVTKSLDQASTPHEIMRAVQAVAGFHKPIQPKRKSVIKVKNKLYTGSDLLKYEEEQRAAAQEKEEQQKARQIELQAKKAILQQRREERMAEKERKKKRSGRKK